jgi:hypothetical protein
MGIKRGIVYTSEGEIDLDDVGGMTEDEKLQLAEKATKDGTVQTNLNAEKLNSKTASEIPLTTEKIDLIGMVNELFTNANNGKTLISNVVGSPLLATDTFQQQTDKIQTLKDTMAINLTNKGQNSVGTENLNDLINKIPNISTGKKFASGTVSDFSIQQYETKKLYFNVNFTPSILLFSFKVNSSLVKTIGFFIPTNYPTSSNGINSDVSIGSGVILGSSSFKNAPSMYFEVIGLQYAQISEGKWYVFE